MYPFSVCEIGRIFLNLNKGKKRAGNCNSFQLISRLQSEQCNVVMCSKFLLKSSCCISKSNCYGATANAHDASNLALLFLIDESVADDFLVTVR